jgi:hypothetical protein
MTRQQSSVGNRLAEKCQFVGLVSLLAESPSPAHNNYFYRSMKISVIEESPFSSPRHPRNADARSAESFLICDKTRRLIARFLQLKSPTGDFNCRKSHRADEKMARPRLSQQVGKEASPQASHSCSLVFPIKVPESSSPAHDN